MSRNFLDQETSPYLLHHKNDPVHWRPWGKEALLCARREDKLILLSVGYAACHWCHVMARESFRNTETGGLINRSFIPIKVDREERPDIDLFYQSALSFSGGVGGWPLTLFLLPDGRPFAGGTYFPPVARYGRPGFPDVLAYVAELYATRKEEIIQQAETLTVNLVTVLTPPPPPPALKKMPLDIMADMTAEKILERLDPVYGGLRGSPKFPQPGLLQFLWHHALRPSVQNREHEKYEQAVLLSLRAMTRGGIYDQIGGGFCRYATDEHWLIPHFEKMLSDNAQILQRLTAAWRRTGDSSFQRKIVETIDWLRRDMLTSDGMFASSLDADSDGEEGAFYVWDEQEIDRLLAIRAPMFKEAYGVSAAGNWEGKNILHETAGFDERTAEAVGTDRARLLEERLKRTPVARDDKILACWNGMTITALVDAAFVFNQKEWLLLARNAYHAVRRVLSIETEKSDGAASPRLAHSWCLGQQSGPAMLDDYAQMGVAALTLYQSLGEERYRVQAEAWAETVEHWFRDEVRGIYFLTAADATDVPARIHPCFDSAQPSATAAMAHFLGKLFLLTGKDVYRQRLESLTKNMMGLLSREPLNMTAFLDSALMLDRPCHVVLIGEEDDPSYRALKEFFANLAIVDMVMMTQRPGHSLPQDHPAYAKTMINGQATAYICRNYRCSPPLTDREKIRAYLMTEE